METPVGVVATPYGTTREGEAVTQFALTNAHGNRMVVLDYGATVVSIEVADTSGTMADVTLGLSNLAEYESNPAYLGAIIGRYANRIGDGQFSIGDETYVLAKNNKPNGVPCHLHGGVRGFDKVVWKAKPVETDEGPSLIFTHTSPAGDEGYPGTVEIELVYTWTNDNVWRIEWSATTDKPTPINIAQHAYFNLSGGSDDTVLDHSLQLNASAITPTDQGMIPTSELRSVAGTPFDFRTPKRIGDEIDADDQQIAWGGGYDHNWVLDDGVGSFALAAILTHPIGRRLEVWTTEPGIQFYTGNFLDGTMTGRDGRPLVYRSGLCLETQHFPGSPNRENFPSTILNPGETRRSKTEYRFGK